MLWTPLRCQSTRTLQTCFFKRPKVSTRSFSNSLLWCNNRLPKQNQSTKSRQPPEIPSFREKISPTIEAGEVLTDIKTGIWRQVAFVFGVSSLAYLYASSTTTVETHKSIKKMMDSSPLWHIRSITSIDVFEWRYNEQVKRLRKTVDAVSANVQSLPSLLQNWVDYGFDSVKRKIETASEGQILCWKIIGVNAVIWGLWQFKRLQVPMWMNFTHIPHSGRSFTILTSMFSHRSFIHLLFNSIALQSFGGFAYEWLYRKQINAEPRLLEGTADYHFLAFFLTAGLFAGLFSHVIRIKTSQILAKLAARRGASAVSAPDYLAASLGASGAIYSVVALTALTFPQLTVKPILLPMDLNFGIQPAVAVLVCIDTLGLIRGWRMFDHAAHLGGALFGFLYWKYGTKLWHKLSEISEREFRGFRTRG